MACTYQVPCPDWEFLFQTGIILFDTVPIFGKPLAQIQTNNMFLILVLVFGINVPSIEAQNKC